MATRSPWSGSVSTPFSTSTDIDHASPQTHLDRVTALGVGAGFINVIADKFARLDPSVIEDRVCFSAFPVLLDSDCMMLTTV